VCRKHRPIAARPTRREEPLVQVLFERLQQRRMPGPAALGIDVADRLLADVVPGEAADDLLGSGPAVGQCGDEGAVSEVSELDADSFDVRG
jgi:hypothetical protein